MPTELKGSFYGSMCAWIAAFIYAALLSHKLGQFLSFGRIFMVAICISALGCFVIWLSMRKTGEPYMIVASKYGFEINTASIIPGIFLYDIVWGGLFF